MESPCVVTFTRRTVCGSCVLPREPADETENVFRAEKSPLNGTWQHVSLHAMLGGFCKAILNLNLAIRQLLYTVLGAFKELVDYFGDKVQFMKRITRCYY